MLIKLSEMGSSHVRLNTVVEVVKTKRQRCEEASLFEMLSVAFHTAPSGVQTGIAVRRALSTSVTHRVYNGAGGSASCVYRKYTGFGLDKVGAAPLMLDVPFWHQLCVISI